jgi:hypothetical protein
MTVKIALERAGLRNVKNKLVQLIHNVAPPHSWFPQEWIAPADLYFLKGAEWEPFGSCRNPALLWANAGPQAIDPVTRLSSRVEFPEAEFK